MHDYAVEITASARTDLDAIFGYIVSDKGSTAAVNYVGLLTDAIDDLCTSPERCALAFPQAGTLRRLVHRSHVVYFHVQGSSVLVARVLHVRQDHEAELEALR